ncbi:GtrA family protein [Actinomyces viscosus]|uniref:GtrA family protein n=1 Tax=Actinomyces viscosus TaxID=1656 RepID=UPI0028E50B03|nr:GtrA family protein [Actinomyces viscosus]
MPIMTRSSSNSLTQRLIAIIKEFMQFGMVGAAAYVIDVGLFNLFQHGPMGFLSGHPNSAQLLASSIATVFSWLANRYWTYRGRTQKNVAREATLFVLANLGGIAITQFCLLFTHHVLGLTSPLADNIAAYVVGFGLGTAFRFVFYHYIVFTGHKDRGADDDGPETRSDSHSDSSSDISTDIQDPADDDVEPQVPAAARP